MVDLSAQSPDCCDAYHGQCGGIRTPDPLVPGQSLFTGWATHWIYLAGKVGLEPTIATVQSRAGHHFSSSQQIENYTFAPGRIIFTNNSLLRSQCCSTIFCFQLHTSGFEPPNQDTITHPSCYRNISVAYAFVCMWKQNPLFPVPSSGNP